ncbi:MAG: hypothetical protein V1752_02810 [Candidatus Firestonebacteria bacterium]
MEKGLPNVSSKMYNDKVGLLLNNENIITILLENEKVEIKGNREKNEDENN